MTLRMIDTFSGIGGFSLAARWLGGIETVQFVEREPFCQRVLAKHWPGVPIHDDICTYAPAAGAADLIVGGFPCQDISTAGSQAGIKVGTRSGLFYELMRVIRLVGPRFVVLENVAAITSGGLDIVLGELAEAGFDAEWACIPASAVGACHRRDRWWLVAHARSSDQPGRPQWAERRGGSAADAGGCGLPEMHGGADSVTDWPRRNAGAPDAIGLHSERWGTAGNVAGTTGAGEVDGQQWQRDGDAADDCGPASPHTHGERCRQQHPPALAARAGQLAWPDAPRRLSADWTGYASQPVIRRGDDGFPGRVDRLKALGNAVVPQVAMIPLARVLELAQ